MSRMQQCYFCSDIVEPEYFLHPEDDVKDYLVNACYECYEKRSNYEDEPCTA